MHAVVTTATEVARARWVRAEKARNGARPRSRSERGTQIETWRGMYEGLVRTHGYLAGAARGARVAWDAVECEGLEEEPLDGWITGGAAQQIVLRLLESKKICTWVLPENGAMWLIDEAQRMGEQEHKVFEALRARGGADTIIIGRHRG